MTAMEGKITDTNNSEPKIRLHKDPERPDYNRIKLNTDNWGLPLEDSTI